MATISTKKEVTTVIDEQGNETSTIKETTSKWERNNEPDYIKLYTNMWCEFNQIPIAYRGLFLELVSRMSYCNTNDLKHSQIVSTGKPFCDDIMASLDWKYSMYNKGLKELCNCGAIRSVCRGVYQINPAYAGKGEWRYNPKLDRGGIEDLIATFNFKTGEIETNIVWADDGKEHLLNKIMRNGLNVTADDKTILKETKKKTKKNASI